MKDNYNLTSKAETKSFDNAGNIVNKNASSNTTTETSKKYKRVSKNKKKEKRKNNKVLESPYSSHPKTDHNRSKSSWVKGSKALKSIFQVYRETGLADKTDKIKSNVDINTGKFDKTKRKENKSDYVQTDEKSQDFSNYLNSIPNSKSLSEFSNRPIKSPKITKIVALYSKAGNKKAQKNSKNFKKSINKTINDAKTRKFQLVQRSTSLHTDSFFSKAKKDYGVEWEKMVKSQNPNILHNRSVQNDVKRSPMFSNVYGINNMLGNIYGGSKSLVKSMVMPKRPGSNTSVRHSDYSLGSGTETSQNSLRQAIMSNIKRKASKNDDANFYPISHKMSQLDSRFTKSLQINSPNTKFINHETKVSVKSPWKVSLRYDTTLTGHRNSVTCLAIDSKYYQYLFSGSKDYKIHSHLMSQISSNYEVLKLHTKYVTCLWFLLSSNSMLVSSGADNRVWFTKIKDDGKFETVKSYRNKFGNVSWISELDTHNQNIAIGSLNGKISVFDVDKQDGKVLRTINNQSSITSMKYHSTSKTILVGSNNDWVKLWDLRTNTWIGKFEDNKDKHNSKITSIDVINSDMFVTSSVEGKIDLWDIRMTYKMMNSISLINEFEQENQPDCINQVLTVNNTLFAGCTSGVRMINISSFKEQPNRNINEGCVTWLCYSELDNKLFTAGFDQGIKVWNIA